MSLAPPIGRTLPVPPCFPSSRQTHLPLQPVRGPHLTLEPLWRYLGWRTKSEGNLLPVHSSLLQIEDSETASPLVGIARLAAQGESIRQAHLVEYFTLPSRALLNRCTSTRVPFEWTINPYRGCEFACKYCYARYTHEFMEMREGVDFERKIYVSSKLRGCSDKTSRRSSTASRSRLVRLPIRTSLRR